MKHLTLAIATAAAALTLTMTSAEAGDAEAGEKVYRKCKACHVIDAPQNRVGPTLQGVIGRTAGTVEGFNYSDSMKESGIVWSDETIGAYLADPKGYIPNNRMAFVGLKKQDDIDNVLAYINEASKP